MDNDLLNVFSQLFEDLYDLRDFARSSVDDCRGLSALCVNSHDTFGVCFYDGKAEAYEQIALALSALLDKAESGR